MPGGNTEANFIQWLAAEGVSSDACTISDFPDTGRGVAAARDIAAEEVIIRVPDDAVLMVGTCCIAEVYSSPSSHHNLPPPS